MNHTNDTNTTTNTTELPPPLCSPCPDTNCSYCAKSHYYFFDNFTNSTNTSSIHCYSCKEGYMVDWKQESLCVPAPECPAGFFFDQYIYRCQRCEPQGCSKCTQTGGCSECADAFTITSNKTCEYKCNRTGQFYDTVSRNCTACKDFAEGGCL
jgi:hypothetical protein